MGSLRLAEVVRRASDVRHSGVTPPDRAREFPRDSQQLLVKLYGDVLRELLAEADLHPAYRALVEAALYAEQ